MGGRGGENVAGEREKCFFFPSSPSVSFNPCGEDKSVDGKTRIFTSKVEH